MKTKKFYKTPSIKVIEIVQTDIIATSDSVTLYLDYEHIYDEGHGE